MPPVSSHKDAKTELMDCVKNSILAMHNDLELRIARLCRHTWQMPAAVGVNVAQQISKEVADIILGTVILQIDKKIGEML